MPTPPLPEPFAPFAQGIPGFTASQMRDYAAACVAADEALLRRAASALKSHSLLPEYTDQIVADIEARLKEKA